MKCRLICRASSVRNCLCHLLQSDLYVVSNEQLTKEKPARPAMVSHLETSLLYKFGTSTSLLDPDHQLWYPSKILALLHLQIFLGIGPSDISLSANPTLIRLV
jgi:hypothetical protein